jgi:hypothetical protein
METKKKSVSSLMGILIVLSIIVIVLLVLFFDQRRQSRNVIAQLEEYSEVVTSKKDSLEVELKSIIVQYDDLKTNNDTINRQLSEQQERIQKLLSTRSNDLEKIRQYEKELKSIREVLRSYIVQIDSLNTQNIVLMAENVELKNMGVQLESKNVQLEKEKEQLTTIKGEAETLIAAGINTVPLNKRGREDDKVERITKLRVDFTVRKNLITEPGPKMFYIRILRPDNVVLSSSANEVINVNGTEIPVSAKREIIYENDDIPVSIFWDNTGDLVAGNYTVEIYSDNKIIGTSELELRESRFF